MRAAPSPACAEPTVEKDIKAPFHWNTRSQTRLPGRMVMAAPAPAPLTNTSGDEETRPTPLDAVLDRPARPTSRIRGAMLDRA